MADDMSLGSPAHAGIDLQMTIAGTAMTGFPRTRGDRPYIDENLTGLPEVPPHTRG